MLESGKSDFRATTVIDDKTIELANEIRSTAASGTPFTTQLQTDERIIARVTDGIYRQPWSAFRELLSNSYDADATEVKIVTNFPEFDSISIRDNGSGMTPEQVAHMLLHIGGSSKRTGVGSEIGTAKSSDPRLSPGGRPLIGKIGIGIFAVSQLTQHFQIITQRRDTTERTAITVLLKTYSEDALDEDTGVQFESGEVSIVQETVVDGDDYGTMVVLLDIRPEIRKQLQSIPLWEALEAEQDGDGRSPIKEPNYHIGQVDSNGIFVRDPCLPWSDEEPPDKKFLSFVQAAKDSPGPSTRPRDLEHFDHYLQMIWNLSLSAPLKYVSGHPFDLEQGSGIEFFEIEPKSRGRAKPAGLRDQQSPRDGFGFVSGTLDPLDGFEVEVDGVQLSRPLSFEKRIIEGTRTRVTNPMMFLGRVRTDFGGANINRSGGALEFECYLYWNSKIVPKENNGVIVRINGASGTLFDNKFLNYRVSEQNRLRQISAEVFVLKGLDGALNIDRESFNSSHPHYIYIQHWLHNALRQIATLQKRIGSERLQQERQKTRETKFATLERHALTVWERERGSVDVPLEADNFDPTSLPAAVGGTQIDWDHPVEASKIDEYAVQRTAAAIVLEAYGVLGSLSVEQRAQLIEDLIAVFKSE